MHTTTFEERKEQDDFAKRAAECFSRHPEFYSFTDGPIKKGCLFAIRIGLGNDCVLIFKLDDNFEPTNYQQAIEVVK